MSARPRTVTRIPCAAVEEARRTARSAHDAYVSHFNACDVEESLGRPCTACFELLTWADGAGKRWEMAEAEAARTARLAAF